MRNPIEEVAGDIIKGLIFDVVVKAAIARAIAALPFLALPIVNPIFAYLISRFAQFIYVELERVVAFKIIDYKTEQQKIEYESAAERLKNELSRPEKDEAAISAAKDEMRKTLSHLIRFGDDELRIRDH